MFLVDRHPANRINCHNGSIVSVISPQANRSSAVNSCAIVSDWLGERSAAKAGRGDRTELDSAPVPLHRREVGGGENVDKLKRYLSPCVNLPPKSCEIAAINPSPQLLQQP